MGPAGSGKSTYCHLMQQHLATVKRAAHVVNLDPAAEVFKYPVTIDVRELISADDVMKTLHYGPNGSLVYCMEYLLSHMEWLREQLEGFEDDYLLIDLPGQIELCTHMPIVRTIAQTLMNDLNYRVCAVYLLDAHYITDAAKFVSGALATLAVMTQLECPHLSILSKCDLLQGRKGLDRFLDLDVPDLMALLDKEMGVTPEEEAEADEDKVPEATPAPEVSAAKPATAVQPAAHPPSHKHVLAGVRAKYERLNRAIGSILEDYSMVFA